LRDLIRPINNYLKWRKIRHGLKFAVDTFLENFADKGILK